MKNTNRKQSKRFGATGSGTLKFCFCVVIALCMQTLSTQAAQEYFQVASGNWNVGGNWQNGTVPTSGDEAYIDSGRTATLASGSAAPAVSLTLGLNGTGGTFIQAAGTTVSSARLRMGRSYGAAAQGDGTYIMNGGTATFTSEFLMGYTAGASTQGSHLFEQNGGTVTVSPIVIMGNNNDVNAQLDVNSGATFNANGAIRIGANTGSTATVNVDGGTLNVGGGSNLANNGDGYLSLNNGASATFSQLRTGNNNGGEGFMTIDNNSSFTGRIIHTRGPSNITLNSGTLTMTSGNYIAGAEQSNGTGTGTYLQSGGTASTAGFAVVGNYTQGTADITGGSFAVGTTFYGANFAPGGSPLSSMTVNNAAVSVGGTAIIGQRGNFALNMESGTYSANNMQLGNFGGSNGTVTQDAGAVTIFNTLNAALDGTGTYLMEGGSLDVSSIQIKAASTFNWNAGALSTPATIGSEGGTDFSTGGTGFQAVRAGVVLDVVGDIDSNGLGGTRSLDLGGIYLNGDSRQNVMTITGNLDLTGENDTLIMGGTPYFLRPFGFNTETYGTIPLVSGGTVTDNFETFIAPGTDGKGWNESGFSVSDPSLLDSNTWYLEQTGAGIFFHYKVQGSVPEPGTLGLLVVGGLFLRRIRK